MSDEVTRLEYDLDLLHWRLPPGESANFVFIARLTWTGIKWSNSSVHHNAVIKWFSRYVVLASKPGAPPEGSLSTSPGQRRKRSCSLCRRTRLILKLLFHKAAGLFHIGLHCHYQKFWMVPIEALHAVATLLLRYLAYKSDTKRWSKIRRNKQSHLTICALVVSADFRQRNLISWL